MSSLKLLGLGATMEKKLHEVDIHSAEELIEVGSREALTRLQTLYPNTCVVILYYLEAAIQGISIKQLEPTHKAELKKWFINRHDVLSTVEVRGFFNN